MEPFEPKPDFEYPIQKPSFDSVVRQKRREAKLKAEQEQYKVVNNRFLRNLRTSQFILRWNRNDGRGEGNIPCRPSI